MSDAPPIPKSNKGMLIRLLVIVLVVLAGFGGWFYYEYTNELGAIDSERSELKNFKDGPMKLEPKPPGMR